MSQGKCRICGGEYRLCEERVRGHGGHWVSERGQSFRKSCPGSFRPPAGQEDAPPPGADSPHCQHCHKPLNLTAKQVIRKHPAPRYTDGRVRPEFCPGSSLASLETQRVIDRERWLQQIEASNALLAEARQRQMEWLDNNPDFRQKAQDYWSSFGATHRGGEDDVEASEACAGAIVGCPLGGYHRRTPDCPRVTVEQAAMQMTWIAEYTSSLHSLQYSVRQSRDVHLGEVVAGASSGLLSTFLRPEEMVVFRRLCDLSVVASFELLGATAQSDGYRGDITCLECRRLGNSWQWTPFSVAVSQ